MIRIVPGELDRVRNIKCTYNRAISETEAYGLTHRRRDDVSDGHQCGRDYEALPEGLAGEGELRNLLRNFDNSGLSGDVPTENSVRGGALGSA